LKANKKTKKTATSITSILPAFEFMETLNLALKFIFTIVVIMITGLFFIFIHDYVTQTTYFSINEISIHGLTQLTKTEALAQAGLKPGDTLLNINAFKIKKKLVAHPWIKAARVTRRPPHILEISIQEEVPLARVDMKKEQPLLINIQGIPFAHSPLETATLEIKLPLIKGLVLEKKKDRFGFHGPLYQKVMTLLGGDFDLPITSITADHATGISLETHFISDEPSGQSVETPITLKLGFSQFKSKFETAGKIFHYLQQQAMEKDINAMDLFNPERVIVTLDTHTPGADTKQGA
jgi:cell division septal protein FtsQ